MRRADFFGKISHAARSGFWVCVYLILDFSTIFPYLAANAATPVAAIWLGEIPDSSNADHRMLIKGLGYAIFLLTFVPLLFGGQIYRSLKAVMTFKIFVVLGFLLLLSLFYASPGNWMEIFSGFFKFGNVPVQKAEDLNGTVFSMTVSSTGTVMEPRIALTHFQSDNRFGGQWKGGRFRHRSGWTG